MTKRILSILVAVLMVMALMPLSAFAWAPQQFVPGRDGNVTKTSAPARATEGAIYSMGFNPTEISSLDGWIIMDADGDGNNWGWFGTTASDTYEYAYEGSGLIGSYSWSSSAGGALTPDNWIVSPAIVIPEEGATLSFWAEGLNASYYAEHFAAYVTTVDPEEAEIA